MMDEWLTVCLQGEGHDRRANCLEKHFDKRRQILFAAACCRLIWSLLDEDAKKYVEAVEGFVDGLVSEKKIKRIRNRACSIANSAEQAVIWAAHAACDSSYETAIATYYVAHATASAVTAAASTVAALEAASSARGVPLAWASYGRGRVTEWRKQNVIFNTFLPKPVEGAWKNPDSKAIAQITYHDRCAFPVLLDALEEAGANVSEHRSVIFYKGNWLVDWLRE